MYFMETSLMVFSCAAGQIETRGTVFIILAKCGGIVKK